MGFDIFIEITAIFDKSSFSKIVISMLTKKKNI